MKKNNAAGRQGIAPGGVIYTEPMTLTRRTPCALSIAAACLLTLAGCNDEVFVKPLPEMDTVELTPPADSLTINIDVKGAIELNLTSVSSHDINAIYRLDGRGDTVGFLSDAAVALPGGIALDAQEGKIKFVADTRGRITIVSKECFNTQAESFFLNIIYQHGSVTIPLTVMPVSPFSITAIDYPDSSFGVTDNDSMERVETVRYTNNGDDTVAVYIEPFRNAMTYVRFTPLSEQPPLPVVRGKEIPVPTVDSTGDALLRGFTSPYLVDEDITLPSRLPAKTVKVKLPPRTTRRYHTFLERKTVSGFYRATLASPSLTREEVQEGFVTVDCPTGYVIGYNDDPYEP